MSNYYTIIGGKRYDAALINNARSKVSGAGDGRISKQDALELWLLAMDGGKITEIEETTFTYLQENLNWTDSAKELLQEKLSEELPKSTSYYKIIDGLRYDRRLLEAADKLSSPTEGNRISFEDAQILFPFLNDIRGITIEEERTLGYLLKNYNWTEKAEAWILERILFFEKADPVLYKESTQGIFFTQYVLDNYFVFENFQRKRIEFDKFEFAYVESEARQQMLDYENLVALNLALVRALDSLIKDDAEGTFLAAYSYLDEPIYEFLDNMRLALLPGDISSERILSSFPSPNRGESIQENWIFGLELFDASDDIYWVIVPRDGNSPAYNYVGGPNVGDIYYLEETDLYFTIQILSTDNTPLPNIMVEVQEPDGKHILRKSNADGIVYITGTAGTYSILATDTENRCNASSSFEWDAVGTDSNVQLTLDADN